MKQVLAIKKIKKGQPFIVEGSKGALMFARPLTKKKLQWVKNISVRFPSKLVEDLIFPVGQVFLSDREVPKYEVAMVYGEGAIVEIYENQEGI